MKVTQCTSCKAAIIVGTMAGSGKSMSFDAAPVREGQFFLTDKGIAVHFENSSALAATCRRDGCKRYTSHLSTCTHREG